MSTMMPLTSTSWFRLALSFLRSPRTDHLPSGYFSGIFDCAQEGWGGRSTLIGGSSCWLRPLPLSVRIATAPTSALVTTFLMALSAQRWLRALGVFNTFVVGLQGCGARGPAADGATDGLAKTPAPAAVAPAPAAQLAAAPRGPLRVIIDAEPVTLSPEGDAWGARIARLTGDPMLPCEPDGRAAASLVSQTPAHLQLRPRAGVRPQEVAAALEGARVRLGSIDRVELLAGAVRIYLKRPDALLTGALCDLPVPGTGPFRLAAPLVRGRPLVLARARGAGVPTIVFSAEPDAPRALGRLRQGEA